MILKTWSETVTVYKYIKIIVSLDKNYSNGIWMTIYLTKLPEKQFMQYRNKSSSYFIHKQNLFEAAKCSCYIDMLTKDQAWLPKLPTYSPLCSPERKNSFFSPPEPLVGTSSFSSINYPIYNDYNFWAITSFFG